MPTNLGHEAISALKVGHSNVTAAYAGHQPICPNTVEITGFTLGRANSSNFSGNIIPAGFSQGGTSAQGVANGQSAKLGVTGEIGAQFTITGSGGASFNNAGSGYPTGGTLVLTQSPQYFGWDTATYPGVSSVGSNDSGNCDATSRTVTFTINPIGSTQLASGVSATATGNQSGGPGTNYYSATASISATNTNRVTTTVGSNLHWAAGSSWSISWSWSNPTGYSSSGSLSAFGSGTYGGNTNLSSPGSGTATWTMTSASLSVVIFRIYIYSTGCNDASNSPVTTGYLYP